MFKKVLIVEDVDFMSSGIKVALESLQIPFIEYAKYCDDGLLKIKKRLLEDDPFDLLISDLSFIGNLSDHKIKSGEGLIKEVKTIQPSIKTIVFSVEEKVHTIKNLCNTLKVDAYVSKDIYGQRELNQAVEAVFKNQFFISPKLKPLLYSKEAFEITEYDVFLLKCLSNGLEQKDIPQELKQHKITPSSMSSIEKRIKLLKENFNANNPAQLIAIVKDFGVI